MGDTVAGILSFDVGDDRHNCAGEFTYNLGRDKREVMKGPDRVHGHKEEPQPAYVQGSIRDNSTLSVKDLLDTDGEDVFLQLRNGKTVAFYDCVYTHEGEINPQESEIPVRFEARGGAEEIQP